jgi:predicted dienelactone hydrolase
MTLLRISLGALLLLLIRAFAAEAQGVVPPVGPGRFAVACSNVAQNFNLAPTDDARLQYWEGTQQGQYVTALLSEPQSALLFNLPVPDDEGLFANHARQQVPYAALVCYPTTQDNPRPDYPIDTTGSRVVPKMQRGTDKPLWADAAFHYPVILYSHGLSGSPLSAGYLETIVGFASFGYVVAAPFHGDPRFADVHFDGLSDLASVFFGSEFGQLIEMQALRPHSLRVLLDTLLSHPDLRDHIDPGRIAGFGASLGGESLVLFAGAELTTQVIPRLRAKLVMNDPRLIAAVGYVPYFGQRLLPAFGNDQSGVRGVNMPFMAIAGTADTTAPIELTEQGVNSMGGSRYLVAFDGLQHEILPEDVPDIYTWSLAFFDAHLTRNMPARIRLAGMTQVSGGAADSVHVSVTTPPTSSFQGLWLNPNESGWGITVTQHNSTIFAAVGTYDQVGHPIWYVLGCPISGNSCTGDIYQVSGGTSPALPWNGAGIVATRVGTGTLTFSDANNGTFNSTINDAFASKIITRLVFAAGTTPPAVDYTDFWSNPNEPGWGISLTQEFSNIVAVWFAYDANGKPVWYVELICPVSGNGCTGDLFQITGGSALTAPWNGLNLAVTKVGAVTFAFTAANNGSMSYSINGVTGNRVITRLGF